MILALLAGTSAYILSSHIQVKTNTLFGRESDQYNLINTILQGQHSVINLVGPPGIGKTTLAINTAEQLEKLNHCYIYIDVSKHEKVSSLVEQLASNTTCSFTVCGSLFRLLVSIVDLVPEKLLIAWGKTLTANTLLILDNIDGIWYKQLNLLYEDVIKRLIHLETDLKLITVSSYYEFLFHNTDAVISLSGIKKDSCIMWIVSDTSYNKSVNVTEAQRLCQLVGGIPKAVKLLLSYALHPMTSESVSDIINGINTSEYGEPFRKYDELLISSDGSYYFIKALYILYDLLLPEDRRCIWLLVHINKNGEFPRSVAVQHLYNTTIDPSNCLRALLSHSLLDTVSSELSDHVFKFHPFIKEFIIWIGDPEQEKALVKRSARSFYGNYVFYHTTNLYNILKNTSNVQLAVRIGSNRKLVNNMLPLLKGNYTKLYQLFKLALKVIEKQCCSATSQCFTIESFANIIFAFSYLTKAVHCPTIHPVSLLLISKKTKAIQSPDKCLQKLQKCKVLVNEMLQVKDSTDYETAEAVGYYNTLMILAHPSPPWHLSLLDLSMIITTANHQCHLHCKTGTCSCGKKSSTELGLNFFLLKNYGKSKKHLFHAFHAFKDDHHCQSILKSITVIALYTANYRPSKDHSYTIQRLLETVNYETLDSTCFLGVMNDLILPFLLEVHQDKDMVNSLINKHTQTVHVMNNTCQQEASNDEQRLDCNPLNWYTISYGVTALKLLITKWAEDIDLSDIDDREDWICSIIRDKTASCEEVFPLFSEVRKVETKENWNVMQSLKFFMNEDEFSELVERAKNITTTFYQLMSI